MLAAVEEIQLKLEGNVCCKSCFVSLFSERKHLFISQNKDDFHCYVMASRNYVI